MGGHVIWGALIVGAIIGGVVGFFFARRRIADQLAATEAEWSKRWRFEEARMAARIKMAHEERDRAETERDREWWRWLQALANGRIPLTEAVKNAPAPRPGPRARASSDADLQIHLESPSMAKDRAETA